MPGSPPRKAPTKPAEALVNWKGRGGLFGWLALARWVGKQPVAFWGWHGGSDFVFQNENGIRFFQLSRSMRKPQLQ